MNDTSVYDADSASSYVADNQFDPSKLVWTEQSDGTHVLDMSKDDWALIQNLQVNMFVDDGEGYIDMGLDNLYYFTEDGKLIGETDNTWFSIDGQPVAFYYEDTTETEDGDTVVQARVPAYVDGVRCNLIIIFDKDHPDGYIAGARYDYVEEDGWGYEPHVITADEFIPFLEKYSILADEFGAKFWGVNCCHDYWGYSHNTPFSTRSYIGGPFQCFLKGNRCWYDEKLPLKEDYDMTLQQLNTERVVLRLNAYHYLCKQSEQKGGCAAYRNRQREKEQLEALIKKWGGRLLRWIAPTRITQRRKNL
jgi:hypothetical protein